MAPFGKVLDLLDDRYLENLHDVTGNVEPFPTLVPYDMYRQNVLVYRMDTSLEAFMALIQEFTDRRARETGRELWTWCVQWDVEERSQQTIPVHSPKKPRLDVMHPRPSPEVQQPQRQAPAIDIIERRVIDPQLMRQQDMLRILIDIVQVESSIVPNFIEFLYRWIDYYEGDGKALKAALRWEIPSLWDFEYHPLLIPAELTSKSYKVKLDEAHAGDEEDGIGDKISSSSTIEQLAQASPTKKMRVKPDLAALERQTEASERLQYREVKYGIQPPKLEEPVPPLINVPRDRQSRIKYYAACFRSRQRAYNLLLEAGITTQQINNYKKLQRMHPKDTPQEGNGNGLKHYHKDANFAQTHHVEKEKLMALRKKHMEITISNKLAFEAYIATHNASATGLDMPLIPPTPSHTRRPNMAVELIQKIKIARGQSQGIINVVPRPLVGKLKSKLFEGAKHPEAWRQLARLGTMRSSVCTVGRLEELPSGVVPWQEDTDPDDDDDKDTDMEDDSGGGHGNLVGSSVSQSIPLTLPRPVLQPPILPPARAVASVEPRPELPFINAATNEHTSIAMTAASITEYIQNLTPEQAQRLVPLLSDGTRRTLLSEVQGQDLGSAGYVSPGISEPEGSVGLAIESMRPLAMRNMPDAPSLISPLGPTLPITGATSPGRPALPMVSPSPRPPIPIISTYHSATQQANTRLHGFLQPPSLLPFPIAPSLSAPTPPPAVAQRLLATQRDSEGPSTTQPPLSSLPVSGSLLVPPLPGIHRNPPSPLTLHPPAPTSPLSAFASTLLSTSPFLASTTQIPIHIYFPKVLVPGNTHGPGGTRMGDDHSVEIDALLLGYARAGSGTIVLSRAVFLPVGVWANVLGKVRKGKWSVVETYACAWAYARGRGPEMGGDNVRGRNSKPHEAVYGKLRQVYEFMALQDRERLVTKRWRVSRGPMTLIERGAVWEGWAVVLDRGIEMSAAEREGAVVSLGVIDGQTGNEDGRRREIEQMMAEDSEDSDMDTEE